MIPSVVPPSKVIECLASIDSLLDIALAFPRGTRWQCTYDKFVGTVIGYYFTHEGKPGVVLQLDATTVVHVYNTKNLVEIRSQ